MREIEYLDAKDDFYVIKESAKLKTMDLICQLRVIDKKLESLSRKKLELIGFSSMILIPSFITQLSDGEDLGMR